ncbi:MAG: hypothetical protein PUC32_00840 [Oscillospiraceae bacterium]|nr:hypothetical protein [Oscillospiraceae bacterium]
MSKQKKQSPKPVQKQTQTHHKSGSFTPLWVKIVAIGCAVLMLGTAVPLTLLFLH